MGGQPVVTPVSDAGGTQGKPTMLYYLLLVVLIIMSIFTLWFYQKSSNKNMPELASVAETVVQTEQEPVVAPEPEAAETAVEDIIPEPVMVTESEPVVVPEPVPVTEEPVIVTEPEPVVVSEPEIIPEPVPVTAEPVVENPFVDLPADAIVGAVAPAVEPEPVVVPTEEEVLATKPAYGVSQQEKMFVADDNYETETLVVESTEPTIVRAPQYTEQVVMEESVDVCSDGNAPDRYGCCTGEEFVLLPDGEQACCAESTGECFPPM